MLTDCTCTYTLFLLFVFLLLGNDLVDKPLPPLPKPPRNVRTAHPNIFVFQFFVYYCCLLFLNLLSCFVFLLLSMLIHYWVLSSGYHLKFSQIPICLMWRLRFNFDIQTPLYGGLINFVCPSHIPLMLFVKVVQLSSYSHSIGSKWVNLSESFSYKGNKPEISIEESSS